MPVEEPPLPQEFIPAIPSPEDGDDPAPSGVPIENPVPVPEEADASAVEG